MTRLSAKPVRERPLLRAFMRFPIYLYRARLGWLMGNRFLMLNHTGRKSGLPRYVVLEVVAHDEASGTYYVVSGWGKKADWYRNVLKTPSVTVQVKNRRFDALAETLPEEEGVERLWSYAQKYPAAFRELVRVMLGERLSPDRETCQKLAAVVPVVALRPR
ncbi:MAG: nitroreductase family deazaflavin-dependent oxidoreductase [Chloroflexi bacterium]|nr:nitroreductase family deazaflavin-dependent oxidoreductase [Chloroflexota bacterium]